MPVTTPQQKDPEQKSLRFGGVRLVWGLFSIKTLQAAHANIGSGRGASFSCLLSMMNDVIEGKPLCG